MPIFEYSCPQCAFVFEELTRASDQGTKTCPQCGSSQAAKILSVCNAAPGSSVGSSGSAFGSSYPGTGCAPGRGFS